MTLPDLLSELAALLPERFGRFENWPEAWWAVYDDEELGWVSLGDREIILPRLEYALREECEARGWTSLTELRPGSARVTVYSPKFNSAMAPTPAEALAAAVIQALRAEKGEG